MEFSFKKSDKNNFPCRTEFERISFSKGISLIKAKLFTGKTHQIRSTLCSMGYPVVGDKIYGKNEEFYLKFIEGKL
jgi:23S rRNA pseudouridine1911/1915/1917 synthase